MPIDEYVIDIAAIALSRRRRHDALFTLVVMFLALFSGLVTLFLLVFS